MILKFNREYSIDKDNLEVLTKLPSKRYLYKFDIKKEDTEDGSDKYSYVPVLLQGYPNKNEVIKYLIRQIVSLENEIKLINDFNEAKYVGILKFEESKEYQSYLDYLALRKEIKTKVNKDFESFGL